MIGIEGCGCAPGCCSAVTEADHSGDRLGRRFVYKSVRLAHALKVLLGWYKVSGLITVDGDNCSAPRSILVMITQPAGYHAHAIVLMPYSLLSGCKP